MTIKIYPSLMEGAPIETHEWEGTIEGWFASKDIDLTTHEDQPVVVRVNGVDIGPDEWASTPITGSDDVEIRILPHGGVFKAVGRVFNFLLGWLLPSQRSASRNDPGQGRALESASAKANEAKLGQVVPELAGRFIRYPDYLTPPRRRFTSPREQVVEFLACVGPGQYQILPQDIKIGDTRIESLGDGAEYQIFEPGQSVAGHSAHEHWHTVREVGSTSSGTAGLELTTDSSDRVTNDPSSYYFNNRTIRRDSGDFPTGWGPGTVVTIAYPRTYTVSVDVVDGAYRNRFTGFFGHTSLSGDFFGPDWDLEVIADLGNGRLTVAFSRMEQQDIGNGGTTSVKVWLYGQPTGNHTYTFQADHKWTIQNVSGNELNLQSSGGRYFAPLTLTTSVTFVQGQVYSDWTNLYAGTPGNERTDTVELDIFAPNGLAVINNNGTLSNRAVVVNFQAHDQDTGTVRDFVRTYSDATLDAIGFTERLTLPMGRYSWRVRRTNASSTETNIHDNIYWFGLKSRLPTRTSYPNWTTMAIRMRSGGRLGSNAENRVSLVATRILPTVNADGTIGAAQPTRDVADFVRHIVDSIGRGDDAINMPELARLSANVWQPRGEYFDYVFDETNVKEAIDTALRAGMSEFSLENGKIRPVRDDVRTVWEQGYSPQNMVKPLRRSADPHKHDDHDGVEVEYIDSNGWVESVVQCRLPGDQGLRVEKVKLDGVTDRTRAWRFGMRHRRAMKYRRKQYSFQTELAGLNSQYLSYVPLVGEDQDYGQSAIMVSISDNGGQALIYTSEPLQWIDGKDHVVAYRNAQGDVVGPFAASPGPTENSVVAVIPQPWPVINLKMEPPHVYFGTVNDWCFPALITEINPQSTDLVSISAVNYDIRVYADDNNSPQD